MTNEMCYTKNLSLYCEEYAKQMFDAMDKIVKDNTRLILDDLRDYVKYDCEKYGLPDVCVDEIYKEIIANIAYASIKV